MWLVTVVAAVFALILLAVNLRLFLVTNRSADDELARRNDLEARHGNIESAVRSDISALSKIPWRSLEARVNATNVVLREHAFSWLRMLDDIERVMPYEVRLTQIMPSVSNTGVVLSFEVVARNRDAMLDFLDNLIADPRFEKTTPGTEQTPEESDAGDYLLRMRVNYKPLEDDQ